MYFEKELVRGYNPYIDASQDDFGTMMDVGLLRLEPGDSYRICQPEKETAVLLLSGSVTLGWNGEQTQISRPDPFRYEGWCLLCPRGVAIEIQAAEDSELYIQQTENSTDYAPVLYTPDTVDVEEAGADGELFGCIRRNIRTFFDYDNAPFSNMVLGEVLNYPGKWSSYPPHHHPQPEVYFYRFDRPQGFGCGFANGEVYATHHNGCAVINRGFHSQCTAPGYASVYTWGIRHLPGDPWKKTRIDEPEHMWLNERDARVKIFKG